MGRLLLLVVSIGLADSANPSTVGPALYLATTKQATRSLAGFILGVFVVFFAGGLVLLLGPGRFLIAKLPHPSSTTIHWLELVGGIALLVVALVLWRRRDRMARHLRGHETRIGGSSILLGGAIMLVELPTAVPYFAVIAALADSGRNTATQIGLLFLFNVTFVAPLLAILGVVQVAGDRGARALERAHAYVQSRAPVLIPGAVLCIAVVLLALGAVGLVS